MCTNPESANKDSQAVKHFFVFWICAQKICSWNVVEIDPLYCLFQLYCQPGDESVTVNLKNCFVIEKKFCHKKTRNLNLMNNLRPITNPKLTLITTECFKDLGKLNFLMVVRFLARVYFQ